MTDIQISPPAPEVSPGPTEGGKSAIRVVLVVAAVLLCLGVVVTLTAAAVGIGRTRVIADSAELPAGLRALTIEAADLPVALRITSDPEATAPRADLRFLSAAGAQHRSLDVSSGPDGARLTLAGETAEWMPWARAGEVTVVLPPALANRLSLTTGQRFGVLMIDTDLDSLVARNDNGAVLLRGSARTVEVHNRHGAVHTRQPIEVRESFSANSVDGDISIDFQDVPPRRIDVASGDGDVALGLPGDGPFVVNASTGSGDGNTVVRVPQVVDSATAKSVVTARSGSGDVTVDSRR